MDWKVHLFLIGISAIVLGILMLRVYFRESTKAYSLVQGRIIEVPKHPGPYFGPRSYGRYTHTPVIEYQYGGRTYTTEHRISAPTPGLTYKVGDLVELRVYEDKPDKAIVNSRRNILLPLICGAGLCALGAVLLVVSYSI